MEGGGGGIRRWDFFIIIFKGLSFALHLDRTQGYELHKREKKKEKFATTVTFIC